MSTSDLSGYFALYSPEMDGTTIVPSIAWGADTPDVYRKGVVFQPIGQFPVNAFTRSNAEPGNTATPVARTGALITARSPTATAVAQIGIIPRESTVISQLQTLSPDPTAQLWAMPGDSIYLKDAPNPAGGGFRVDFYVRPTNFPELDAMIKLPLAGSANAAQVNSFLLAGLPEVPYARAPRVVYFVTPPIANFQYTLVPPELVPVGYEQVFIGVNNNPFVLQANEISGGADITNKYYVPGRGVVSMISGGGFYAPLGAPSNQSRTVLSGQPIGLFRGVQRVKINVAAAEAFALPPPLQLPTDAVLIVVPVGAGAVSLVGNVNNQPAFLLTPNQAAILVPHDNGYIGVRS